MDQQLRKNPILYAVLLLLVVPWGAVLTMPVLEQNDSCSSALALTGTLLHDASQLLKNYARLHGFEDHPAPEDVLDATVSGSTPAEKLYSMAVQGMLLHRQLSVVEEDNKVFWANPDPGLQQDFTTAKSRLSHHFITIGKLLKAVDPDFISPPTPATPDPQNDNAFAKKNYGFKVLYNLTVLATNVERELKTVCENV